MATLAAGLAWMGLSVLGEGVGATNPPPFASFPIQLTIIHEHSAPSADGDGHAADDDVAAAERLRIQLDSAKSLFGPFGVAFHWAGPPVLLGPHLARVETRGDRDVLATHVVAHVINVFIVDALRDIDDPAEMRRGVHWHGPNHSHYVILVATAPPAVLAHELGHFFGNPHSKVVDNIMSYERSGGWVSFDTDQGKRILSFARTFIADGELLPSAGR